jgi:GT2 family glycosyltransferase
MTLVSVLIVNYNGAAVIIQCLRTLLEHSRAIVPEIIVVDNASSDGSPDLIAEQFPQVKLIKSAVNLGFGQGNNLAAQAATGEFLLLLNPDTIVPGEFLPPLVGVMDADPQVAIVAPRLVYTDGRLQVSISYAISLWGEYRTQKLHRQARVGKLTELPPGNVDIVVGAAMLIRRRVFEQVGGFDPNFFMYFEESDLCERIRKLGWRVHYFPQVSLIHWQGHSTQQTRALSDRLAMAYRRSQLYYYAKHRPWWEQAILRLYLLGKFSLRLIRRHQAIDGQIVALVLGLSPQR